ncbi:CARDB domain-containing protein [Myxococcus sp. RHSTA-1-4]|uniref:CARDB domain-containing protein n=1 Tax=Myxococcus sp. RHSTA-1-4 TaxID=2874601 RepID=UPI001CC1858C|nr:CARDB domain-containing protein [Myxococcus sp. RHSTA-1-4]MBZ4420466.1 hypothetical protein [Myxococcus sp. RHSTA-1-4]
MKQNASWVVVWLLALLATAVQAEPVGTGVAFLLGSQDADGGFGGTRGEEPGVATPEVLEALRAVGLGASAEALRAELFFASARGERDSELVLRRQLALAQAGFPFYFSPLMGHAAGFEAPDVLHRALTLRAWQRTGQAPVLPVSQLAQELALAAGQDGCFSYADNEVSVSLTAEVVLALRHYSYIPLVGAKLGTSLECLKAVQGPGGSFGSVGDTALAVLALLGAPGTHEAAISSGRSYLVSIQQVDGSWEGSVRATALAVRALGTHQPDWRVLTDEWGRGALVLSDAEPLLGATVTARLDVENRSGSPAPATPVRFVAHSMETGADVVLREVTLPPLEPRQMTHVATSLSTTLLSGRYTLRAVVDPDGAVPELDERNNAVSAPLRVRQESDVAVTSQGIHFTSTGAEQVRIEVSVRNLGAPLPRDVQVDVYKGTPGTGGVKLGSGTVPAGTAPNASSRFSLTWSTQGVNGPTAVHVVVDPADQLSEADEQNNRAFRFYHPGTALPVDLSISSSDVTHEPGYVVPNQPLTVRVVVHNLSANDANRVVVGLYAYGSRDVQPYGLVELPMVPARGSAVAELRAFLQVGTVMRVVVDPQEQLADTNRLNNETNHDVPKSYTSDHELEVSWLSASREDAQDGTPVTISAAVLNRGQKPVTTLLRLLDLVDGKVWEEQLISLNPSESRIVALGPHFAPPRTSALRVCLDPDDTIRERNEKDNCQEQGLGRASVRLSVHSRDVTVSPVGAHVGEKVRISAVVRNSTARTAQAVVEWWQGRPAFLEGIKIGETPIQVPAAVGASPGLAKAHLDWVREEGPVEVFARVVAVMPPEARGDTVNNVAGRHLFLESLLNLGLDGAESSSQVVQEVRTGRLTGRAAPELVVGYLASSSQAPGWTAGVALYELNPAGSHSLLWRHPVQAGLQDLVLADLEGDGQGEIIVSSTGFSSTPPHDQRITVLRPDGTTKWEKALPRNRGCGFSVQGVGQQLALGDVNADGIADIAYLDTELLVLSGADGHELFTTPLLGEDSSCYGSPRAEVLDVDGDGANEILVVHPGRMSLVSHTGALRWQVGPVPGYGNAFSIADVDLDGSPEVILPQHRGPAQAWNARTGERLQVGVFFDGAFWGLSVGALRQDGLPYVASTSNSGTSHLAAFTQELDYLWETQTSSEEVVDVHIGTLADLRGWGRPQLLFNSTWRALMMLDGRDGRMLTDLTSPLPSGVGANSNLAYRHDRPPVVADIDGDGRAEVLVAGASWSCRTDIWPQTQAPDYGCNQVFIYASSHWAKQPTAWPTRFLRKGQVGEDLKVSTDYRWWTKSHGNTFNQQFDQEPARLLPDLAVTSRDLSSVPVMGTAGASLQLSAVVHNLGGLPASNVKVSFFDGDPKAGGRHLGDAVATGPLAVRKGTATASLPWVAYPEGEHLIHVVVNPDEAIEESGRENNSASFRVFVQPGGPLCDLAMDAARISATPAAPGAGESVTLTATVRNVGGMDCAASLVTVHDGAGTSPASFAALRALEAGQEETVSLFLTALPGTRVYRWVADATGVTLDVDRGNNEASFQLVVPASALPDLLVASLSASPASAFAGEAVALEATVRNQGAATPASRYRVRMGTFTMGEGALPPLRSGEATTVVVPLTAPEASAQLLLEVDPDAEVAEFLETNNTASTSLEVAASQFLLSMEASPASAGPETLVGLSLTLENQAPVARDVRLDARVVGPDGRLAVTLLESAREVLGANERTVRSLDWTTGRSAPGVYRVRVSASVGGRLLARGETSVTVWHESAAGTQLVTDRGTYAPGQEVLLSQRATNLSRNAALEGAVVRISVLETDGAELYASTRPLPRLPAGGFVDTTDLFHISPHLAPGAYVAVARVLSTSGVPLAEARAAWTLAYEAPEAVKGTLSAQSPFPIGPALMARVSLANTGGMDVENEVLDVLLLDAASLQQQSVASMQVSLAAGHGETVTVPVPTSGLPEGVKLLVARLNGRTLTRILATAETNTDREPPVITVQGVAEGLLTREDVTPVIEVRDASPVSVVVLLDNQPFTSGTPVSAEGAHILSVTAVDVYGNRGEQSHRFTLDKTPPQLVLNGADHQAVLRTPVALSWEAEDAHPGPPATGQLNAASIPSGYVVDVEGEYVWTVEATDAAGNAAQETRSFCLDFTPPSIAIAGVAEGAHYKGAVSPVVEVTDLHPVTTFLTLDGEPFTSGDMVTTAGVHLLHVVALDGAGNQATAQVSFTLDFTTPTIQVAGVTAGTSYSQSVVIEYTALDDHLAMVSATMDGAPFSSGDTVGAEGPHTFVVRAVDLAGNEARLAIPFTLDFSGPVLQVSGVVSGAFHARSVTIHYSAQDANLASLQATLDGTDFTTGSIVDAEGPHTLVVRARDTAGNESSTTVSFTLDFTLPDIEVSGVSEGATGDAFVIGFTATDTHLDTVGATLDERPFAPGTRVDARGTHALVVTATDKAGNSATRTVHFEVVPLTPVFNYALCAFGSLTLRNHAQVQGSGGSGPASVAAHGAMVLQGLARVSGDVVAGGSLSLEGAARVEGRAYHGGAFSRTGQSVVEGGAQRVIPAPAPCECGYDVARYLAEVKADNDNATLATLPDSHLWWKDGVFLLDGVTVALPAGRYHAKRITLSRKAVLKAAPGARVELFVEEGVTVGTGAFLGGQPSSASALLVVSGADAARGQGVVVANNSDAALSLYAPAADISLSNNSRLYGAVVGRNVAVENHHTLMLTPGPQQTPPPLTCQ